MRFPRLGPTFVRGFLARSKDLVATFVLHYLVSPKAAEFFNFIAHEIAHDFLGEHHLTRKVLCFNLLLLLILENITWDLVNRNTNLSLGCLVCVTGWLLTTCSAIFQLREGREKVLFVGVRPIAPYVRPLFAPLLGEHKGMPSSNFSKCIGTQTKP